MYFWANIFCTVGIFSIFKRKQEQPREVNVQVELGANGISLDGAASSLVNIRGDGAMGVMAYKRALDVLSGSVARLPFHYLKQKGDVYEDFEASPFHYLLSTQPQLRKSVFNWKREMVWQAYHDGDAFIWPRIIDGEVVELVLISRGCCSIDDVTGEYYITDVYNGVYGTFDESQIVHIMFNTLNGRRGVPLWKMGNTQLSIIATGDKETLERFGKGGAVRGLITNDKSGIRGMGEYQDEQLEKLANSTDNLFKNGERIVSLPGDVDFKQLSLSSTDMQFLESRKFSIPEVSRMTGVPPIYLYDMAGSNYKMPEQADVAFLTQTLDCILEAIETEFQRKLVSRSMCCKRKFEFDREQLFKMDLITKANYYSKMIQNGTYSINDVRKMENKPPVDGGDVIYLSTNTAVMGSSKMTGENKNDEETK